MSSERPTNLKNPKDPKDSESILVTTSVVTSSTKISKQGPTDSQISLKRPMRPSALSSLPSSMESIPSIIMPRAWSGDLSFTPSPRQLYVLDSPGLRTPPQGLPSQYLNTSPSNTASLSRHEARNDYFHGARPHASSQSRNDLAQVDVASGAASPSLTQEGYPVSCSSSKGSNIASGYSCTSDSLASILGRPKDPYKAHRPSSESLTMFKQRGRRKTEGAKLQLKRRCNGTCNQGKSKVVGEMASAKRNCSTHWSFPPSQITPTALEGIKVPNTRKHNCLPKRRGRGRLMSEPAAPLVSRRWSSGKGPTFRNEIFDSNPLGERNRSSSFTAGAGYNDIVRSLRERLTIRKLPNNQMLMPSAITLRRPSASNRSDMSSTMATSAFLTTPRTASIIPSLSSRQPTFSENERQDPEAYIITREDVEAVMELLHANLPNTQEAYISDPAPRGSSVENQSPRGTRLSSLSFTSKGLVPMARPAPCEIQIYAAQSRNSPELSQYGNTPITTVSPIISHSPTWIVNPGNPGQYLQISQTNFGQNGRLSEAGSERSVHEVIWEERNSPESHVSERDKVHFEVDSSECSSQANTPSPGATISPGHDDSRPSFQLFKTSSQDHRPSEEKGAFDPKNARISINKWSWQCESEANEDTTDPVTDTEHETPKDHVISFPPLPRKSTNEWRSPLPDMATSFRDNKLLGGMLPQVNEVVHSHSLYSIGIDARTAPSSPALSGRATTPVTRRSWLSESPPERVCSWLSNSEAATPTRQKSDTDFHRKKSVIKAHPKAPARSGKTAAIGSSIGACTGARKRASSPNLAKSRRVTIVDNPLIQSNHFQGGKSWFKSIQGTAHPRLTMEGEAEEAGFWSTLATRAASKDFAHVTPSPPASPHCNLMDARSTPLSLASPRSNLKNGKTNNYIIPLKISPSISETPSVSRSSARESLSMIQDKYFFFPKADLKLHIPNSRKNSSPRKSTAYESLLRIQERFPSPPKPDHSGIYDSVTGINRKDKVECSRDCQHLLHNCDACASNMSTPSVDWIG
ncbi:hypothetical protein SBOR_2153 [Sclerotinia borealis F-4128]|uniref:Uncharacterized protein n=1 Tax=Sclerotinia borealis (strain F-4128) TaxID=1432307 RepID=W9CSA8_SCLBF|nr:hypothetical protein SBOR_2153 [Sclerotinia borealis F-4128]